MIKKIKVIGAGLAGSELALQLANSGWIVDLYEMRPKKMTPAHETGNFAEIVCSNSFKSNLTTTASGLLKQEMRMLGSYLLDIADQVSVPAGNALAVNRERFAEKVTQQISKNPNINLNQQEVTELDDQLTVIATGPLTSDELTSKIIDLLGDQHLFFFDAIAPIVSAESIDKNAVFSKSRYDKGESDYLNCPFSKEEYLEFVDFLLQAEKHQAKEFENEFFRNINFNFYENCTPIEELARRGIDTLRYGVMRPVGLENPRTNRRPYAVIQLRAENKEKTAYNLVGCQTMLKYGDQKKAFRKVPGLQKAEFLRLGSIHRNTYLNAPRILNKNLSLKKKENVFVVGQLAGVEGYVESIFTGILLSKILNAKLEEFLPAETISGQLWRHMLSPAKNFQPMNANFGLVPKVEKRY